MQVIDAALARLDLQMLRWGAEEAAELHRAPELEEAFICNREHHWFALRRLGEQWWNLDSVAKAPTRIGQLYLSAFLAQLAQEGRWQAGNGGRG